MMQKSSTVDAVEPAEQIYTMLRLQQNDYLKRSEIIVKDRVINAKNQCVTGG